MLKDRIIELLEETSEVNGDYKRIVSKIIDYEQKFISFGLKTNDLRLKEIKQKIREEIESIVNTKQL